jgi:hypothetical protein
LVIFLASNLACIFFLLIEKIYVDEMFSKYTQMLKQKVDWLEASNMDLRRELEEALDRVDALCQCALGSQVGRVLFHHPFY